MRTGILLARLLALASLLAACRAPVPVPRPTAPAPSVAATAAPPTPTAVLLAPATPAPTLAAQPPTVTPGALRVLADEALRSSFTELATAFSNLNPGLQVDLVFLPGDRLLAQARQGAAADLVVLAGDAAVREAVTAGLIEASRAVPLAEDRLAVVTPLQSSAAGLEVLAQPGVRLGLAREGTPLGAASRIALAQLVAAPPQEWAASNPAPTLDGLLGVARTYDDAPALIAGLRAGQTDAAILYTSAVTPALESDLRFTALPDGADQPLQYSIAPLRASTQPDLTEEFIVLAASAAGQATLSAYNLYPIVSSAASPPEIFPSLEIIGSVDRPLSLSSEELARRSQIEVEAQDRRGDRQRYRGVALRALLEEARPQPGAHTLLLRGSDDYAQEVPLQFITTCADCIITIRDDGSLQAILPGYDQAAWVRLLVQLEIG